ncbi:signal peptidase II [Elusimicrobium simillimum]|uniref:signal peptidase II n=1 Tax=Elusimicrobium simillimum TaxID=3143438 RepID=UPI003C702754
MHGISAKLKSLIKNNKATIIILLILVALDRITKVLALDLLRPVESVEIFKYFHLTYLENTGMAFGILQNGNLLLTGMMIVVIVFILKSWKELAALRPPLGWLGLVLILGGAIGNLYDRIVLGFVVDFIDFRVWPVFNVADSAICVGAALVALAMFLDKPKKDAEAK